MSVDRLHSTKENYVIDEGDDDLCTEICVPQPDIV